MLTMQPIFSVSKNQVTLPESYLRDRSLSLAFQSFPFKKKSEIRSFLLGRYRLRNPITGWCRPYDQKTAPHHWYESSTLPKPVQYFIVSWPKLNTTLLKTLRPNNFKYFAHCPLTLTAWSPVQHPREHTLYGCQGL